LKARANFAAPMVQAIAMAVDVGRAHRCDRAAAIALGEGRIRRHKHGGSRCKKRDAFRDHDVFSSLASRLCESQHYGSLNSDVSELSD
jgi:hypothetical protein